MLQSTLINVKVYIMPKQHILIVDDEEDLLELVRHNLERVGYTCTCATTGTDAVKVARQILPDLIVLDLMLPGIGGFEVCGILKQDDKTRHIPIVMLTAKGGETSTVHGLGLGADDYITKPFSPKILLARIAAVLRRNSKDVVVDETPIRVAQLYIHPGRREVLVQGIAVSLTQAEFSILHFLAQRPGWVFSRAQIVDALHGPGYPVTDRAIDVQIVGLRKKLGACADYIETIRGVGYRFKE